MSNGIPLAYIRPSSGATGPQGATGATGPQGAAGSGAAISTDAYNIITTGSDGKLYASLEGGSEVASPIDGATYIQGAPVAQQFYSIVLTTSGNYASLTVNLIDPWVSEDVFAPFLTLTITHAVTALTVGGAHVTGGALPLPTSVPVGGAGYLFQWNNSANAGHWVRLM